MLQDSYPTLDMFLDHSESKLCLKKEYVSKFHDVIINAAHNAMDKHIPHTGDRKLKVIPGWDIEMDCARQSSLFWHSMWNECGRKQSGIVYDIMKKIGPIIITNCERCNCRSPRQCNSSTTYWNSTRAIRKHNYNTTQMVDGTSGDSNIANIFWRKYKSLFNSVESSDEEIADLSQRIQSAVTAECECTIKTSDESNHCHEICRTDVSKAVPKLKSDKISDNGLVYSNNFINGTSLLYKSLSILLASMIYHGFAPQTFICANIIPIPKGSKASLTSSDKYRIIAISSVIGKILDHVIIDRLSDCLKTTDYQFGFKSKSSTVLCSTMVNETIQYYIEKGGKRIYLLLLDATKAFDKVS